MTVRPRFLVTAFLVLLAVGTGLYWHATRELVDGSFEVIDRDAILPSHGRLDFVDPSGETSSKCIGKPVTPICAVETYLACMIWERPDLCRMVRDHHRDDGKSKYLTRTYRLDFFVRRLRHPSNFERQFLLTEISNPDLLIAADLGKYQKNDPRLVVMIVNQRGCAIEARSECIEFSSDMAGKWLSDIDFSSFIYVLIPESRRWKIIWIDTDTGNSFVTYSNDKIAIGAYHPTETEFDWSGLP